MANILSIATALPEHRHLQSDILKFMQKSYGLDETEARKLAYLYSSSGIESRYSAIPDFGLSMEPQAFFGREAQTGVSLERRMALYKEKALPLSLRAAQECLEGKAAIGDVTHLITVSCTGMSAPGLDLELMEALGLRSDLFRTSVNFMGCYAAIHALKWGNLICAADAGAKVLIVATELCTLHFQPTLSQDNAASGLLFADGCAAVLMSNDPGTKPIVAIDGFHSLVAFGGKPDMGWELGSSGFLMTLSSYVPKLIKEDIAGLVNQALEKAASASRTSVIGACIPAAKKSWTISLYSLHCPMGRCGFRGKC